MNLSRALAPIAKRLSNLVSRAVLKSADDSKKLQLVQLDMLAFETRDDVERPQNYGFTSKPVDGAEAFVICVGGRRDHGLAIVVEDRRYRISNLNDGEVAVYDKTGSSIVLKSNGDIQIIPSSGKVKVTGDLEASGDVKAGTISLKGHVHSGSTLAISTPAGAGSASGNTAAAS